MHSLCKLSYTNVATVWITLLPKTAICSFLWTPYFSIFVHLNLTLALCNGFCNKASNILKFPTLTVCFHDIINNDCSQAFSVSNIKIHLLRKWEGTCLFIPTVINTLLVPKIISCSFTLTVFCLFSVLCSLSCKFITYIYHIFTLTGGT